MQSTVAFLNLGSYYVIGVPIGLLLGYVAHLQIRVCKKDIAIQFDRFATLAFPDDNFMTSDLIY